MNGDIIKEIKKINIKELKLGDVLVFKLENPTAGHCQSIKSTMEDHFGITNEVMFIKNTDDIEILRTDLQSRS